MEQTLAAAERINNHSSQVVPTTLQELVVARSEQRQWCELVIAISIYKRQSANEVPGAGFHDVSSARRILLMRYDLGSKESS